MKAFEVKKTNGRLKAVSAGNLLPFVTLLLPARDLEASLFSAKCLQQRCHADLHSSTAVPGTLDELDFEPAKRLIEGGASNQQEVFSQGRLSYSH